MERSFGRGGPSFGSRYVSKCVVALRHIDMVTKEG